MSEKPKLCPFCGGEATLTEQQEVSEVWCVKCGISTGLHPYQGAIKHWNTRPAEDALKAEITRYRRALHNLKEDCQRRMKWTSSSYEKLFLCEAITHIDAELAIDVGTKGGEDE